MGLKNPKVIKAIYLESYIEEEEWNRNKYYLFQDVGNETTFSLRSSTILDMAFNFKKKGIYTILKKSDQTMLIANDDMALYRVGQRKVFVYIYEKDETHRLDGLMREDIFKITRNKKAK
jgi:hypothetical protein